VTANFPEDLSDRFKRFKFRHFAPNQDHYEHLAAAGQSPDTMIVSCCDSRVDPETIFSAMPGELFVMRNVANLVPPYETTGRYHGVSAALEFAALNLRVRHIVILGHSGCGGVGAALKPNVLQTEAQFITSWMSILDEGRQAVIERFPGMAIERLVTQLEMEAVRTSLKNLRTFPCVRTLEGQSRLALHGAYFDIATGTLSVLNQTTDQFGAL
jgi:carbonic anhydrase